ncbi:heme NO-binding domain-containing protein [Corallococcus sp. M34]|uniref:heme NO-binding domain-containing protein n=1 Tax=Citreicoccus inhibens TaxID=2849499 RepID=UPI001C244ED8|nr:heme NO-binding domain-containing protein [Citreicoccus inhibens]MBU8895778.1 heme NO-binding domain-containing protein [Citreicoccus inhibens]
MHGILFHELRGYAQSRLGTQGWESLLERAGLPQRIYLAFQQYPDEEVTALVAATAQLLGQAPRLVLEDFGEFIAPSLLRKYRVLLEPNWSVLDIVERAEHILRSVRQDAKPPPSNLRIRREEDVVLVSYGSPRRLCGVGIGFIRGLAREMGQRVVVHEHQCMHQRAPRCELQVLLMP